MVITNRKKRKMVATKENKRKGVRIILFHKKIGMWAFAPKNLAKW
jgi:hypothetical protein